MSNDTGNEDAALRAIEERNFKTRERGKPDLAGSERHANLGESIPLMSGRDLCYDPDMNRNDSNSLPDPTTASHILQGAIGQIHFARDYTLQLLDATPRDRWFEIPSGLTTNVAWQVGHLAVSQYGLLMFRIRGRRPDDLALIPGRFRKAYGRGSKPSNDPSNQPTADELLGRLGEVFELGVQELSEVTPEVLLEPVEMPYAAYPIKLGAILFCPLHEHIHAGQIGLIRRGLGLDPIR